MNLRYPYYTFSSLCTNISYKFISFEKLKSIPLTKIIIVSSDSRKKLKLIKENFPEIRSWQPDAKKDFTELQLLSDKTQLIIINLVQNNIEQQLKAYMKK
ncbi:MAG: hypothetical protein ABIW34_00095 [Ginsengibacter sp.]